MYNKIIKRIIDIVLSFLAIIVLFPLFVIIGVFIKLDSKGPIFFKQKRLKYIGKYFYILKFRTMAVDTPKDIPTNELSNPEMYITKAGKFLRRYSLDEIPQIINIFKGDMSIIGPRPALWNQDFLISERERYGANSVRPGLTGLAQISGRDELEDGIKAKLDGEYVKNLSLGLDIKLFFGTILRVLRCEGVVEGTNEKKQDVAALEKVEM